LLASSKIEIAYQLVVWEAILAESGPDFPDLAFARDGE
jgi:hypothetical protein